MPVLAVGEGGSHRQSYSGAGAQDGRHITPLDDALSAGELATLVGLPIYNNGDIADLCLTADEWAALTERRRRVGWPLNFLEECDATA